MSLREPQAFYQCSGVSITDCKGFVPRTMTANGETFTENLFEDELLASGVPPDIGSTYNHDGPSYPSRCQGMLSQQMSAGTAPSTKTVDATNDQK